MKSSRAIFSHFSYTIKPVASEIGGVACNGKSDERETDSINSEWAFSLCMFRKNEEISDHFIPSSRLSGHL